MVHVRAPERRKKPNSFLILCDELLYFSLVYRPVFSLLLLRPLICIEMFDERIGNRQCDMPVYVMIVLASKEVFRS